MTIEHVNAQSLLSNFEESKMCVNGRDIDVLCVSETWLRTNTPAGLVSIPNYVIYRCDNGRGGGVCIYTKKEPKIHLITLPVTRQVGVEGVWVSIESNKYPAVITGCVYRHPRATVHSHEYLQDVSRTLCISKNFFFLHLWRF